MRITLVNAGIRYHRPQVIPGTPLPNSTSPPSPVPMKSSIQLEPTPCDPTSTTQATCNFDTESLPEFKGHLDNTNRGLLTLQAQYQPLFKSPVITLCILNVLIT